MTSDEILNILFNSFLYAIIPAIVIFVITRYRILLKKAHEELLNPERVEFYRELTAKSEYLNEFSLGQTKLQRSYFYVDLAMILALVVNVFMFYYIGLPVIVLSVVIFFAQSYLFHNRKLITLEVYGKLHRGNPAPLKNQKRVLWTLLISALPLYVAFFTFIIVVTSGLS